MIALKSDRSKGFLVSALLHACLFGAGGALLTRPIEYGVQVGSGGIEVNLVAAPLEASAPVEPVETLRSPETSIAPQPIQPASVPSAVKGDGSSAIAGKDVTTFQSAGGAITQARPNYLKNPAPAYPRQAREKGWEGLVVLHVTVDVSGRPVDIEKETSSGYEILDESALKTVRSWRFLPARLAGVAVRSSVRVPIRFELEDSSR